MAVAALTLTPAGRLKLARALAAAREGLALGLARELQTMRAAAAEAAPSPAEEAALLSRGVTRSGREVGTPEGGRFIRRGDQVSLREAILTDPIRVDADGNLVAASTGDPARINARTGFFWMTRRRGIQGPTLPFNQAYVQAVEDGGAVWVVVPRPGTRALEPEDGVYTQQMTKTIAPRRMFSRALAEGRQEAARRVGALVREVVRRRTREGAA